MNKNSLRVSYASAVHDQEETKRVLAVLNEHRTIMGREIEEFEKRVAKKFGKKYGVMVNSGSSANLLSFELLNLPEGSEVITPVLTFSTTIAPLLQKRLVPVFIDVVEGTYNIDISKIEKAITKKTKAIMIPLLIGNAANLQKLRALAKKHKLYFIEDSCDTFAAEYDGKPSGMYSDISTTSFYGSHIITAGGGGGMLMMDNPEWYNRARMLRGWGRSSSLFKDSETIEDRFKAKIGTIPYDAKFIFGEVGYNFLPTEISAAFGNAQLDKLTLFKKTREKNFKSLLNFFKKYEKYFVLPIQDAKLRTQWLAFPLTIRQDAPFTRLEITQFLEENNIQTRPIFTGNILLQPGFKRYLSSKDTFPVAQTVMQQSFLIGCHHGMEEKHLEKLTQTFTSYLEDLAPQKTLRKKK